MTFKKDCFEAFMVLITCVHQSSELYGSDRSFADAIEALSKAFPNDQIEVILPKSGPLAALISGSGAHLIYEQLWVPRRADGFRLLLQVPMLPLAIMRARRRIVKSSLVYVNTVVVWDYIIAAGLTRNKKTVIHVREIVPASVRSIFRFLLRFSGATLVYNSEATKTSYDLEKVKEHVVYNGFKDVPFTAPPDPRGRPLRLLLIGRINAWKGQDLTIEALALLRPDQRSQICLRIVGSVYEGQEGLRQKLMDLVLRHKLEHVVEFHEFAPDPELFYKWADVVLVPSRSPEPFGRVAIEGMAYNRPVVGAAHGGLLEIIENGRSGWLFEPNQPDKLATQLDILIEKPHLVTVAGAEARARFEAVFTLQGTQAALIKVFGPVPA